MRTEGKYNSFPHKNFKPQGRKGRSSMINLTYDEIISGKGGMWKGRVEEAGLELAGLKEAGVEVAGAAAWHWDR